MALVSGRLIACFGVLLLLLVSCQSAPDRSVPEATASHHIPTLTAATSPSPAEPLGTPFSVQPSTRVPDYWPTVGWRTARPEDQGMDGALLDAMLRAIASDKLQVHGVIVVRNGYIVTEAYYPPFDQQSPHVQFSITKSFVATLIGIAIDDGRIAGPDVAALGLLPVLQPRATDKRKSAITLEDFLTMRTGLAWSESDAAIMAMVQSRDWTRYVLDLPMTTQPGERFNYCTGCSHILSAAIRQATGRTTQAYARERLLAPLGITNYEWETDRSGLAIGGWGLWLTPRDMAKLGYLYSNGGRWDGRQIVSEAWVRRATALHANAESGWGYGYQWWVYPKLDAYFARGRGGQLIGVIPSKSLVVVLTADMPSDGPLIKLIEEYVVPAVS